MADIPITIHDQFRGCVDSYDLPDNYTLGDFLADIKNDPNMGPTEKEWPDFVANGGISIGKNLLKASQNGETLLSDYGLVEDVRIEILQDANVAKGYFALPARPVRVPA